MSQIYLLHYSIPQLAYSRSKITSENADFLLPLCTIMKRTLFIFSCLFLQHSLYSQWKSIGNPANFKDLFDVQLIGSTAYAVGQNSALLKSIDSGKSWTNIILSIPQNMRSVYFLNKDTGFIIGENARIQKTNNGGSTWTQKYVRTAAYGYDIQFRGTNGVAVGQNMLAVSSRNMGETWLIDTTFISNKRLNAVCILPNGQCWAVGDSGYILNKPITRRLWTNKKYASKINFTSISAIGDSILIICGGMPDSASAGKFKNIVLYSQDGGITFSESALTEMKLPNGAYFINKDTGFICGSSGLISKSYQVLNKRGLQITGTASSLNAIFFDHNIGLCVGDGGSIYRTINRGGFGLDIPLTLKQLFSIFPNPSTGRFTIDTDETIEKIAVFNALGKEVETNFSQDSIYIEASGIYLILIQINQKQYQQTLVVD